MSTESKDAILKTLYKEKLETKFKITPTYVARSKENHSFVFFS